MRQDERDVVADAEAEMCRKRPAHGQRPTATQVADVYRRPSIGDDRHAIEAVLAERRECATALTPPLRATIPSASKDTKPSAKDA